MTFDEYYVGNIIVDIGIIVSDPILMFTADFPNGESKNFWCYNINANGNIYNNIPEEFIRGLNDENE